MRRGAIARFIESLSEGDPIAVGFAAVFALGLAFVGLLWILEMRDKAREKSGKKRK